MLSDIFRYIDCQYKREKFRDQEENIYMVTKGDILNNKNIYKHNELKKHISNHILIIQ